MAQYKEINTGDVVTVHGAVAAWYAGQKNWEAVTAAPTGDDDSNEGTGGLVALEELNKPELLEVARREKLKVNSNSTKDEILAAIKGADNPSVDAQPVTDTNPTTEES